ncbi:ANTAR domain-containing protein [Kineosporia sp. J2-2]|uniref:ANTAR domain-containing protein n=1 Tax=Kineosporia corallincola TaxID=2835133 RepID=A0ABS5TRP7_9ACTN|nr:ANTAR domain-containing protein [Kineosporia corallincola]MBT0773468.1 ANTAR domain-containing protein [Kineosporia corallincola]
MFDPHPTSDLPHGLDRVQAVLARFGALTSDWPTTSGTPGSPDPVNPSNPLGLPDSLCLAARDALNVDAAAICVFHGPSVSVPVAVSDPHAARAEEFHFGIGDGPCLTTSTRHPELIPDISAPGARNSWPLYTAMLPEIAPYRAVFAFPLSPAPVPATSTTLTPATSTATSAGGTARPIGALRLYRRTTGPLDDEPAAAAVATEIARRLLTGLQDDEAGLRLLQDRALRHRSRVWQAQNLIMRTHRVPFGDALDLLRAAAFGHDRPLREHADDVLAGRSPMPTL